MRPIPAAARSPYPGGPPAASTSDERYLPARQVWERYGVTPMTIHRWLRDERMHFPKPVYFGRFRYWKITALTAFENARANPRAAA